MQRYKIFTDSTADLSMELAEELEVSVVPTEFFIAGKSYLEYPDSRELDPREFYRLVRSGEMPKTSVINPNRFLQYFEPVLKDGYDILHIVFSSGLTTTMQNSRMAAAELKEKYPERNIVVVDSRAVSLGEGLLVYYAAKKRLAGASMEEAAKWVEDTRDRVCHWFTVDDLNHLRRGGRVNVTTAMVGGMLNIKPIMHMTLEGKLEAVDKVRGRKTAIETLLGKVESLAVDIAGQTVMIVHADCEDEANFMADEIKSRFGVERVYINFVGAVIGTHSGPGALAVFFIGSEK
jgi:DegV family protein with EDD domain